MSIFQARFSPLVRSRLLRSILTFSLLLSLGVLTACDLILGSKPNAIITSPPSGSTFHDGEDIAVQSVSTDAKGVVRVELIVDGQVVRTDAAPSPQDQFTLVQTWKATQGSHTIIVKSYNGANNASEPAAISVSVIAGSAPPVVAAATRAPTSTTAPGGPSPTTAPAACTNNAAFISDVTVPDGTQFAAGQTFNKIWRLSNNGTCTWGAGYQFVFVSGEAMTANTVIAVPTTAPGGTADLLVPMTAPAPPGAHTGAWRIRSSTAALFGQAVSVKITVPGAAAPTATQTVAPATGCSGTPVISSFTASPNPVTAGTTVTLTWGAVTNADSVEIDQGIGGVGTPGSTPVTPGSNTTYSMTARCGTNTATSALLVTVNAASFANFGGHWDANFGTMDLIQTGANINGSYTQYGGCATGTINGTVSGNILDGTWGGCGGPGTIRFVMAGGGQRWDGNYNGTNKWCAARSGLALTAGCGFSGHWNLLTAGVNQTADLTQTGNSISGTYSGGTLDGTVSQWTLNGHWHQGIVNNTFIWIIDSTGNLNFRGSYEPGSNNWCGWRDGQPAIPNSSCHN